MRRFQLLAANQDVAVTESTQRQITINLFDQRQTSEDHETNTTGGQRAGDPPRRVAAKQHLQQLSLAPRRHLLQDRDRDAGSLMCPIEVAADKSHETMLDGQLANDRPAVGSDRSQHSLLPVPIGWLQCRACTQKHAAGSISRCGPDHVTAPYHPPGCLGRFNADWSHQ